MSEKGTIPFGPQHPVLPEPIHLKLVVEDEKVVEAYPAFGFVHRGLETLAQKKTSIRWYMLLREFAEYVAVCMDRIIARQ